MSKILVTGATGNIGKAVIKALTGKGASFVAGARNKEKAGADIPAASIVPFDFADPSTFSAATEEVDRTFLLGPPLDYNLAALLTPFIDHLKQQGILRIVYIAAMGLETIPELPFHDEVIRKLKADGFDYTILKPSFFAQNFKNYEWDNITKYGITYVVAGDGKAGFIDVQDIGRVAAQVLTEDGHNAKEYELTGPELLSYHDAAALLTEVTGRQIVYSNPSAEEYTATLKNAGVPDFVATYMIPVYSLIKDGKVGYLTDDVEQLTGKKPTPLLDVLQDDFKGL